MSKQETVTVTVEEYTNMKKKADQWDHWIVNAAIEYDERGQLVLYTGLDKNGNQVKF